jgi:uncharacterized metal-binding protein YceD (DUF177 family)
MNNEIKRPPLSRPLRVDEIRDGASGAIAATQAEMAEIAELLDLRALEGLTLTYRLIRDGAGRLRLQGQLKAGVTQTCVVSLEPVPSILEVPVETEFWPAAMIEAHAEREEEPGLYTLTEWPEPIRDGRIDLGPVIYETLATALDPYPKREGASFEWPQEAPEAGSASGSGPFAALGELKRR